MTSTAGTFFASFGAPLLMSQLGRSVVRRVLGDIGNTATVTAIVDWSAEPGTNQVSGDGVAGTTKQGDRIRRSCTLTVDASLAINAGSQLFDVFVVDDELLNVIRVTGRDDGLQDVLCVVVEGISSRQSRPIP